MRSKLKADLLGPGYDTDPYPKYARLREQAPICRVRIRDDLEYFLISRYDDAREALADPRLSRDPRRATPAWREADRGRPLEDGATLGAHLLTRDPPDHTRLRALASAAFTPRRAEAVRARVQQIADSLVDEIEGRGEAELLAEYAYPLATTVLCEVLGVPVEDRSHFRQWTSNAVTGDAAPPPGEYLRALVETKRRAPGDDLVTTLVRAGDDGELDEAELLSMLFLLLIAGHENSVGLVGNGILALLAGPGQLSLLRESPDLLDAAVAEIMRYDGPMELAAWRFATEPVEIGGTVIPAGAPVMIALAAAHRDPARFEEPDRFDITRRGGAHLGFGHGIHYCLGAPLARVEGTVALGTLVRRLPDLALAEPVDRIPRQPSLLVRGLHELPVTFTSVRSPGRSG